MFYDISMSFQSKKNILEIKYVCIESSLLCKGLKFLFVSRMLCWQINTCSKSAIETLEEGMKYVPS